jgi:outer membrane protein TolC
LAVVFIGPLTTELYAQSSETSTNLENTPLNLPLLGETSYPQLEEYLQIALEENPELQSMQYLYESEKERVREVGVMPDPELTMMYDFNPMMSGSQLGRFSVSAMQMIPWFGSLNTRRSVQKSNAEADRAAITVRQLEILRDLQIIWFDIAEVQEQIQITEQNIELLHELERLVEIRYETGRAAQADILRIQMEEERLKNRVENLRDRLNPLKAEFNQYLNRAPESLVETTDIVQSKSILYTDEQIERMVSERNPAFDVIEARANSLDHQNRLAKLNGRPSFGLGLEVMGRDFGPMSMNPEASESFIGMATVRLPLFRSRTRSQQEQIIYRKRALDSYRHQTENRLMTNVESVLEEIRTSERNITMLNDELIPRANQALNILSEDYSVGLARFDELLQIQRELLDLEFERIEAVVNQNKAVVKLESLIGSGH